MTLQFALSIIGAALGAASMLLHALAAKSAAAAKLAADVDAVEKLLPKV